MEGGGSHPISKPNKSRHWPETGFWEVSLVDTGKHTKNRLVDLTPSMRRPVEVLSPPAPQGVGSYKVRVNGPDIELEL
jgi:hypothetical protein